MATASSVHDPVEDVDESPEVGTSSDPRKLRKHRGYARATHTKTIKKAKLAVRMAEEVEIIRNFGSILVRDFEDVDRRHSVLLANAFLSVEERESKAACLRAVDEEHQATLRTIDDYLASQAPAPSVRNSSRYSIRSTTSSVRSRLAESRWRAAEADLKVKQAEDEAKIRNQEDQALFALQASVRHIEEQRRVRDLTAEKKKHELTGRLLRQQIVDDDVYESPLHDNASVSRFGGRVVNSTTNPEPRVAGDTSIVTHRPAAITKTYACADALPTAEAPTAAARTYTAPRPVLATDAEVQTRANPPPPVEQHLRQSRMDAAHMANASIPGIRLTIPEQHPSRIPDIPHETMRRHIRGVEASLTARGIRSSPGVPATYTPDAWIKDVGDPTTPLPPPTHYRPPKLPLPKFDGQPRDWPMFIQSFRVQVHDACTSDAERLAHLCGFLSTKIQRSLGETILNPGLYKFALEELQRKYGSPQIVAQAFVSSL